MNQLRSQDTLYAAPEDGAAGAAGKAGPSIFYAGDWNSSMDYVLNDEFRPYVSYTSGGVKRYYLRKGTDEHCTNKNPYSDVGGANQYWSYTEQQSLILARKIAADEIDVTDLAACEAFINNLVVKALRTSSGKVKIEDDGSLEAEDVVLNGTFKSAIKEVHPSMAWDTPNDTIAKVLAQGDYFIYYGNSVGGSSSDAMPLSDEYVGRKVYLMIDDCDDLTLTGRFYYGSAVRESIFFSKQFVEMFCTKINNVIYWVVLQVHELNTTSKYGLPFKTLAYGRVKPSAVSLASYKTFDKSSLTFTKISDTKVRISFPSSWFDEATEVFVSVSGGGTATATSGFTGTYSQFASVSAVTASYVEVVVSGVFASGGTSSEFFFEIKNIKLF